MNVLRLLVGESHEEFRNTAAFFINYLKDRDSNIRQTAVEALQAFSRHCMQYYPCSVDVLNVLVAGLLDALQKVIPTMTVCLKNPIPEVRQAAINGFLTFAEHGMSPCVFPCAIVLSLVYR